MCHEATERCWRMGGIEKRFIDERGKVVNDIGGPGGQFGWRNA